MKKFTLKQLSITLIFASLFLVSCSETDEMVPTQQQAKETVVLQKQDLQKPIFKKPVRNEDKMLELQSFKLANKDKATAAKATSGGNTWVVPRDFQSIQDAVNYAYPGDKIRVRPGYYYESVIIDDVDDLTISAMDDVDLDGYFNIIDSQNITISGFNIMSYYNAIYVGNSSYTTITGNTIDVMDYYYGMGIDIADSPNTTISNNTVNAYYGITVDNDNEGDDSINSKILNNTIESEYAGIYLEWTSDIKISKNKITGVEMDMEMGPPAKSEELEETFGIYIYNSTDSSIDYNSTTNFIFGILSDGYGIMDKSESYNETNNTFKRNNTFKNKFSGLYLYHTAGDRAISNQCLSNDVYGIIMVECMGNTLKNNIAYFNGECGIYSTGYYTNRFVSNYTDCEFIDEMDTD